MEGDARLHSRRRAGWGPKSVPRLAEAKSFAASDFRCLHACFLPRSRLEVNAPIAHRRLNLWEQKRQPTSTKPPNYKRTHYMHGPFIEVDIAASARHHLRRTRP